MIISIFQNIRLCSVYECRRFFRLWNSTIPTELRLIVESKPVNHENLILVCCPCGIVVMLGSEDISGGTEIQ